LIALELRPLHKDRVDPPASLPTPAHLSGLLEHAPGMRVPVAWLIGELGNRSFSLTLFSMAVLALLPGASTIMGLLIA
jgi:hypothetical protein